MGVNTKCTVNDSLGDDVLLAIDMYMYILGGLGWIRIIQGGHM